MQWNLTSSDLTLRYFELTDNNRPVLSVKMDHTGFVYLTSATQRRSFMIEQRGNYKKRFILRNEYGVKLMQLCFEKGLQKMGYLESDDNRYDYVLSDDQNKATIKHPNGDRSVLFNMPPAIKSNADTVLLLLAGWHNLKNQQVPDEFALTGR